MIYKDWLNEWLNNYVKITAKHRTFIEYSSIVFGHIIPLLGNFDMEELTLQKLQIFVNEMMLKGNLKNGKGLSSSSVNLIINVLKKSIRSAYNFGIVTHCFVDKIIRPKLYEKNIECFSKNEQKQIINAVIKDINQPLIGTVITLYTGVRIGELLALEWTDIDFHSGLLYINKSCHDGKTDNNTFGRIIETPKTNSSKRVIPIPKQLLPLLRDMKKRCSGKYVISNNGKIISVRTYQRRFSILLQNLNIKHRGFHVLRHTFATRALECGMDVKTLSEILGHKSPTITLNRYVHSMLDHKKNMMNIVGKNIMF